MNRNTVEVFHALMKKGWIDRREDAVMWSFAEDPEVLEELEDFKEVMGIDLFRAGDRLYMIPTQENDLFLKNNVDFRADISTQARSRELYMLNYLAIYLIYLFFSGEGRDPRCRDFITKEEFIAQFTSHCKSVEAAGVEGEDKEKDYSTNFIQLASGWLSKIDGPEDSTKLDCKYGLVNKLLIKFRKDEIFDVEDGQIKPTRKMRDLMPYFLRKDRITEIQNWIKEGSAHAEDP